MSPETSPPPPALLEDPALSYRPARKGLDDNLVIEGDNVQALAALERDFAGEIRCIYADPPFNTGQSPEHYEDEVDREQWLGSMRRQLVALRPLLHPGGAIFVHLDNAEVHHVRVMMDDVFGRDCFLAQIAYERSGVSGLGQGGIFLVNTHEYILCYCRDRRRFASVDLLATEPFDREDRKRYRRALVSPGERVQVAEFTAAATGEPVKIFRHEGHQIESISLRGYEARADEIEAAYVDRFEQIFRTTTVQPANLFQRQILGACGAGLHSADYRAARGRHEGKRVTSYYLDRQPLAWLKDIAVVEKGRVVRAGKLSDFWPHHAIPKGDLASEGGVEFRRGKKPEHLLHRLIKSVTRRGDRVLDPFGGSGTTGAVAHKLARRWIMIERGPQCVTHIAPRLRRVIDGDDPSGVTRLTRWRGGGGFGFYRLSPSP